MNYYDQALENLKKENYDLAAEYFFNHLYHNNSNKDYPLSDYLCNYNYNHINTINFKEIMNNVKKYYINIIEDNKDKEIKASSYAKLGMISFYINNDFLESFNLVYDLSDNHLLLNNIGLILLKNGKINEAIQFFKKAIKISNNSIPEIVFNLHTAYSYNN